MKRLWFIS